MDRIFTSCFTVSLQYCPWASFFFRKSSSQSTPSTDSYVPTKKPTIVINNMDSFPSGFECEKENRRMSSFSGRSPGDKYIGKVNFTTQYISIKKTLIIKIQNCTEMDLDCFDSDITTQIRVLVPSAKCPKQHTGFNTGFQPLFDEILLFTNIEENDILACTLRFRLYRKRGRNKPVLKGETEYKGKNILLDAPPQPHSLKLENPTEKPLEMEPQHKSSLKYSLQRRLNSFSSHVRMEWPHGFLAQRAVSDTVSEAGLSPVMHRGSTSNSNDSRRSSMVDACGRFCSQPNNDCAELLVSLCYYADHGRLIVGIERGSLPHSADNIKSPDTFVKIVAQGEYGNEVGKQKTDTVKSSTEPRYDYSASFQIPQSELESMSVILQVCTWSGVLRRKTQIGWFALGLNSTSPDAQEHWQQMIQGLGTTVSKWHAILPPE